ncbi:MAG: M14 family zinc carboxypeptidase, partial [Kiritimatiellaeota bacterium]|nr:M14 family zinc carboxypeptidase [Kiritimatiellota bacterium]
GTTNDPVRFEIRCPAGREESDFFVFALDGVAGKTIQVKLHTDRARYWTALNPVFAYLDEQWPTHAAAEQPLLNTLLANPDLFEVKPGGTPGQAHLTQATNGAWLPDTHDQKWTFMTQCAADPQRQTFILQHTFAPRAGEHVVVAMRYPYTPQLGDALMRSLQQRWDDERQRAGQPPDWSVEELGKSQHGRPLWLVRIGALGQTPAEQAAKPGVLFYAREHGDEHDTSWVAQGVIDYLLEPGTRATELRRRLLVLVIPMLDPDCAADNEYEHIIRSFHPNMPTPESNQYAAFFRDWVNAGHRLDLTFNLHNVDSNEGPHVFPFQFEGRPERLPHALALHASVRKQLTDAGYSVGAGTTNLNTSPSRLGGYLSEPYGTLHQFYEHNSQAAERHLTLLQLQAIGPNLLSAAEKFMQTAEGREFLAQVDQVRAWRQKARERYEPMLKTLGNYRPEIPIMSEHALGGTPRDERDFRKDFKTWEFYLAPLKDAPHPELMNCDRWDLYRSFIKRTGSGGAQAVTNASPSNR